MAAMGVKADPVNWSDGNENSIKYDIHDNEVVIEVGNEGALAAFFAATDNEAVAGQQAISGATSTKLKIKSMGGPDASAVTLSAFDIAALNVLSTYTEVDLSEVSVGLANMNGLSMSNLQYLILPEGNSGVDMWNTIGKSEFKTQNPNLKMAASVTNVENETLDYVDKSANSVPTTRTKNTKKLAIYSWKQNSTQEFVNKYRELANGIDKLDMAGLYGDQDLYYRNGNNANKVFQSNDLHYFDFTGATFDPITITSYTTKHTYGATYTNGISDSYSGATTKTYEEVTTNALYYLNRYNVMTCSLPTGNNDIPPQLFCTTNGWNYPLIKIEIPDNITSIGREAFYSTHLKNLVIPPTVTNVQDGAFGKCQYLENVEMTTGDGTEGTCGFGEFAFGYCYKLKNFTMREGVIDISTRMFEQCASLESFRIPSTCETVGMFAFSLCYELHSVTIPVGVRMIGYRAFNNSGLTDLYLLAKTPAELPLIYGIGDWNAVNSSQYAPSTFTPQNLIGNKTTPQQNNIQGKSSDAARAEYQEKLSSPTRYLGSNNCYTYLHYPDELKEFMDGIVYNDGTYDAPSPGYPSYIDLTGKTYISETYDFLDAEGKRWPAYNNLQYRINAGGVTGLSVYPWRQFALTYNMKEENIEYYSKKYDNTWYTICFPWNVTDDGMFETFNQKLEIVEFKGVEVIADEDEPNAYNLVLHFDDVSVTHYMDGNGVEYNREFVETWTRQIDGVDVSTNLYRYTNKNDESDVITFDKTNSVNNVRYYQIQNILVVAGHPYMLHPAAVEYQGEPTTCTISGVKRINATTNTELADLEKAGQVSRTATTGDATTSFTSPLGGGGTYTFHGYLGRDIEENGYKEDDDKSDIPQYSYFLAAPEGTKYPKYYREMANPATDKWTLYTAIITPDQNAIDNIEALNGAKVQNSANVAFGEWEQVEATAIEEIIADAQEKGQEVREVYMNVVYNINGQVVRTDGQIEGLPKGLYIVNGKKYMVK